MTVGIDPGLSDALFFIDPTLPATGTAIDLPAHALVRGGKKHEVDPQGLLALLTPWGRWRGDAALCEALTTAELRQLTAPAFQSLSRCHEQGVWVITRDGSGSIADVTLMSSSPASAAGRY